MVARFAVIIVSLLIWSNNSAAAPAVAGLDRAIRVIQDTDHDSPENFKRALADLNSAASDKLLRGWVSLFLGQLFERMKQPADALKSYKSVPADSAPSIDAAIGIIRLKLDRQTDEKFSYEQLQAEIDKLLETADAADRDELRIDLLYFKGRTDEALNRLPAALEDYRTIRREDPLGRYRFLAADAAKRLRSAVFPENGEAAGKDRLTEAELLIGEEEYTKALEEVQLAGPQLPKSGDLRAKALLLEERILRKMGRASEADHRLEKIAAGKDGADEALMRLAKAAWKKDDLAGAKAKFQLIAERFPSSVLAGEAAYNTGRVLEEEKLIADAREAYRLEAENGLTQQFRIKSIKRLAWLAYLGGDKKEAAESFSRLRSEVQTALKNDSSLSDLKDGLPPPLSRRERNELAEEFNHANFWLAATLTELSADQRPAIGLRPAAGGSREETPQSIFTALAARPGAGYYSLLAASRLKQQYSLGTGSAECKAPAADPVVKELGIGPFESSLTRPLADREIAWRFSRKIKPLDPLAGTAAERGEFWRLAAQRVGQSSIYGTARRTVSLAYSAFRTGGWEFAVGRPATPCLAEIIQNGSPRPYPELFNQAAKQTKLPASLLYAISKTESHFDPNAQSAVGAAGLMQLMPDTAKAEGLARNERVIDPAVNIRLGAKHLAGLVSLFGQLPQAIAAYNGGKPAVYKWNDRHPGLTPEEWIEQIGFPETYDYVKKVLFSAAIYSL